MAIFDYKTHSNSKIPNFFWVGTSCLSFFRKLGSERVLEIAVFQKLGLERVFRAFFELVPTRENLFRPETRLECSEKSSECRALIPGHFHLQLSEQEVCRDQFDFVPAPLWSTSARVEMRPGAPRARGSGCRWCPPRTRWSSSSTGD